ncbi:hypothetical protein [Paenibacillus sp.]|uniref:hypothetical protein n=1 Tax=Paenibacillus sp. TaxID=58172 RepID=UPI002838C726|nr:hypothetical protein [Paenibacillus sp.]MDR0269026.1 hypothetical protein [Paenibacillus sp.]
MNKKIAAAFLSTALMLSFTAVASADNTSVETSNSQSPIITNLGTSANDDLFTSGSQLQSDITKEMVAPMGSDGRNISYEHAC